MAVVVVYRQETFLRLRGVMAVAVKVTECKLATVAKTVFVPASLPNVSRVAARPLASVVLVAAESVPPPAVTEKATWAPLNGSPF